MEDERNWFVGVDWASKTHHVRVSDAKGRKVGEPLRMAAKGWLRWRPGS
jgi:hypothetical protein